MTPGRIALALAILIKFLSWIMMEAGPPQAVPNYRLIHTQPTPRPLGGKITFISAPTFGSMITPHRAGTAGD